MGALIRALRNSDVPKILDTTHIGTQKCINRVLFIYLFIVDSCQKLGLFVEYFIFYENSL